jgi:segregation and condensation protein A
VIVSARRPPRIAPASAAASLAELSPHAPFVGFATERRADAATVVRVAEFDGPLGLLLTLIEARRLDVLTVPLGALAEAYLDAVATLEGDRLANIAGFVAVAGQLIVIKSRALLPRPPEPAAAEDEIDPEEDLRRRLLVFRAYRDAARGLAGRASDGFRMFAREPSTAAAAASAGAAPAPAAPLDPALLVAALDGLLRVAPPPPAPAAVLTRTVTLAERAAAIRAALRAAPVIVLQDLLAEVRERVVVAVTFLALLELVKRREATAEQAEPWGPIIVRRRPGSGT